MKKNQKSAAEYSQKVTQTAKRYAAPALVIASLGLGSCSKKDDQPPKIHELETSITSREGDATTYKELDTFWTSDNETGTPITNITTSADLEGVLALDATGGNNYTVQQNGKSRVRTTRLVPAPELNGKNTAPTCTCMIWPS